MASFGVGIGDVIAVGALVWKVYGACRGAVKEFAEASAELLSLHTAITAVEKEFPDDAALESRIDPSQRHELKQVLNSCRINLLHWERLVKNFGRLGTPGRKPLEAFKFSTANLPSLRSRLALHTNILNVFLAAHTTRRLRRIEDRLEEIIQEIRLGFRDAEVFVNPNDADGDIASELLNDGFEPRDILSHRDWFLSRLGECILGSRTTGGVQRVMETFGDILEDNEENQDNSPEICLTSGDITEECVRQHSLVADSTMMGSKPGSPIPQQMPPMQPGQSVSDSDYSSTTSLADLDVSKTISSGSSRAKPRSASRPASIRSEISEYDGDGRHIRTKIITTTTSHSPAESATAHSVALSATSHPLQRRALQPSPPLDSAVEWMPSVDSETCLKDIDPVRSNIPLRAENIRISQLHMLVRSLVELSLLHEDPINYKNTDDFHLAEREIELIKAELESSTKARSSAIPQQPVVKPIMRLGLFRHIRRRHVLPETKTC